MGDPKRAERLSACFDKSTPVFVRGSNRGFVIHTGLIHGVRLVQHSIDRSLLTRPRCRCPSWRLEWHETCSGVSLTSFQGIPMIDFLVREARAIIDGPVCTHPGPPRTAHASRWSWFASARAVP